MDLVIDACVLRAAGLSDKPLPKSCRTVLDAVRGSGVRVVVCNALLEEWREHKSRYAQQWISSMFARRLVSRVNSFSGRSAVIDAVIGQLPEPQRSCAEKDGHLIKVAVDHGRVVVSQEIQSRRAFACAAATCREIAEVVWANPESGEVVIKFISGASDAPSEWFLGHVSQKGLSKLRSANLKRD